MYFCFDRPVLAERVHGGTVCIRMRAAARPERDTRHAVGGQMHGVGAGAANDRRRALAADCLLRCSERLDDCQILVEYGRRIADIDDNDEIAVVKTLDDATIAPIAPSSDAHVDNRPFFALEPYWVLAGSSRLK